MRRFGSTNIVYKRMLNQDFAYDTERATYKGVGVKVLYFLAMVLIGAFSGIALLNTNPNLLSLLLAISGIGTIILSIVSMVSNRACKVTGALYCIFEGMLIGVVSLAVGMVLEGAVTMALLSTIAVFGVVAVCYITNLVKVGNGFIRFLTIFALGFIFSQLIFMLVSMFTNITYSSGLITLFSLGSTFLATLYLFFDMENIRHVVEGGLPQEYEWTAAFGLCFTLIWLYVEILRLIVIFADRD